MKTYIFGSDSKEYYLKSEVDKELRTIRLEGWKGKDLLKISSYMKDDNLYWTVLTHRKDKHTGEIAWCKHTIPDRNVKSLIEIIKTRTALNEKTKYRQVAHDIILKRNLQLDIEEFNGGRNRARVYFPYYYYPVRIIEHLGLIKYGGRGTIVNLKISD